jgi:hypothetical protein
MSLCSTALFQTLLEDLAPYLSKYQEEFILTGALTWPDASYEQVASASLIRSFYKKFVDTTASDADDKALAIFESVNLRCQKHRVVSQSEREAELLGTFKRCLYEFFYPGGDPLITDLHRMLDYGSTGPGASVGARGTDFYTKMFDGPLTATSSTLYIAYKAYVSQFPLWAEAEKRRASTYGDVRVVEGNKLYYVPKNDTISRTICSEPVLNMFFQLGLGRIIERRLDNAFGINLARQPVKNRELARIGSMNGSFCTIDLSSASDSLALGMLREVLPRQTLAWFELLRSPVCELPNGSKLALNMLSTMGNGYTFPLQTALFSCVVAAAYEWRGIRRVNPYGRRLGNWSVFGDDIIVDTRVSKDVIDLLGLLGFQVNAAKTFVEGPFRESCGSDFINGRPVRGVYIKSLRTPQDRYVAINRLVSWSAMTGIVLPRTCRMLLSTVKFLPVPPAENDDAGVKVPSSMIREKKICRYTGSYSYYRYVARPTQLRIRDLEIRAPKGAKRRLYNPDGLLLSFLRGDIRGSTISVRSTNGRTRYSARTTVCPNWDYIPVDDEIQHLAGTTVKVASPLEVWRSWESSALINLLVSDPGP